MLVTTSAVSSKALTQSQLHGPGQTLTAGRRGDLLQRFLTHGLVLIAAELAGESLEAVDLIGCGG